jgi:hypothetical protein
LLPRSSRWPSSNTRETEAATSSEISVNKLQTKRHQVPGVYNPQFTEIPSGLRQNSYCVQRVTESVLNNEILLDHVTFYKAFLHLEIKQVLVRLHGKQWHLQHDLFFIMSYSIHSQITKHCNKFLTSGEPNQYSTRSDINTRFNIHTILLKP